MRYIGTLNDGRKAFIFSTFLRENNITHQIDTKVNENWDDPGYGECKCAIWIEDEDKVKIATEWLNAFNENPQNPLFAEAKNSSIKNTPPPEATPPPFFQKTRLPQRPKIPPLGWITKSILVICTFIFILTEFSAHKRHEEEKINSLIFTSPIERTLLFDYPLLYQRIERFIAFYGTEEFEQRDSLSPGAETLLQKIEHTPAWPGWYQLMLKNGWQGVKEGFQKFPTFEKIREGEVWRFFSPCFLHGDLFHIFFNMLWLIVLGRQLEERLSRTRYILLIALIAAISNTAQYLMSGPNFIGFSGVLCGMLAFIWVRQKKATWEGYHIDKMTLGFICVFIGGISLLQFISFILEKSIHVAFSPNIANMAHLTGAFVGYLLGQTRFFSWRHG